MQEKENNELPAEIDHPPGRIWRVRTRRCKKSVASNEEKQDDKERFNNESSSDSDDSLMPAAKIKAAEESSHNSSDDGDVDGDVSMLSPLERKAKTRAREKITEIVNAGKRPRKQKPSDQTRASVIRAASVDSQQKESQSVHEEPKASDSDASLEEYTLHPVAQKSDIATSSALYSRSQESQGVLQTASANMQPLHDDYDSSQNKAIHEETVETKTQEHARRSFPEFAREMSAKLRVDLRENVAANKRGLRIDVWEVDSDDEQSQNKKGPVRDVQISDIKIANANVQSNNDNDAVASNEIFEALQSQTWADYDPDNAQISSDARQLRGYSEQQECADMSATLIRSDDIPSKPPEIFDALIERDYFSRDNFKDTNFATGDIMTIKTQFNTNFCLFVKEHVSEKCMRKDLHKIIKSLKALLRLKDIDCHFREGEMVMLLKEPRINKFSEEYTGPYEIKRVDHNEKSVILLRNGAERKAHIDKIKRAYAQKPTQPVQNDINEDEHDGMKLRDYK
ncbi:unnamed protein product, partial [Trichogramma brassicae]